jgi:hypothetical protein
LDFDDPFALLAKATAPPWDDDELGDYTIASARWEPVTGTDGRWDHQVAWCPRAGGGVAIHFFAPRSDGAADPAALATSLCALAQREMQAGSHEEASTVGGFHGARDLLQRAEVRASALPSLISGAVQRAAQHEAETLRCAPIAITADEAWFNALAPGGWNALHTHPGSAFSGVVWLADGGCCEAADQLAGRLVLLPSAPHTLSAEQQALHVRAGAGDGGECPSGLRYLALDPVPGCCVVFPSFVPHFVTPTPPSPAAADDGEARRRPTRVSVAFNFGATT